MQTLKLEIVLNNSLAPGQTAASPISWGWAAAEFVSACAEAEVAAVGEAELSMARGMLGMLVEVERVRLEGIAPEHLDEAVGVLALDKMPQALRAAVGGYDTDASTHTASYLYDRLFARGPGSDSYLVPDETALNVMEWHIDRVRRGQAAFEASGVPEALKQRFAKQVRAAAWMPVEAEGRLERLDNTRVFLDDGFSGVERQVHGLAGRRDDGTYEVCLQPTANSHATTHEFVHIVEEPEAEKGTMTGLERIFGNTPGVKLLQEAITDQTASSLQNGHPGITDMDSEFRRGMEYPSGGLLLHVLCEGGVHPIDVALFRNTRFEDVNKPFRGSFADQLLSQLRSAFPENNIPMELGRLGSDNRDDELLIHYDAFMLAVKLSGADVDEAIALLRESGL